MFRIISFLKIVFWATLVCGLIYFCVQQNIRLSANNPQIQMAEDAAAEISSGKQIDQVVPVEKVDIARSLAPYMIVFNSAYTPLLSSAVLNGQTPVPPQGVLAWANVVGENRLTWQPAVGVRSAIVVVPFNSASGNGYVLVGQSLREVELLENHIQWIVFAAWLILICGAVILEFGQKYLWRRYRMLKSKMK